MTEKKKYTVEDRKRDTLIWQAAHPERVTEIKRNYRQRNRDKAKAYTAGPRKILRRAGVEILAPRPRPATCEICGGTSWSGKLLHFDHCHTTGKFRGWLCGRCNLTLGQVEDDVELLLKLIQYLRANNEKPDAS